MNFTVLKCVLLLASAWRIQSNVVHFTVLEEQDAGVKIGSLGQDFSPPFRLHAEHHILLHEATGDLFTQERLDRESLCPQQDGDCVISSTALVSPSSDVIKIIIHVVDINDNAPVFETSEIHVNVPEDSPVGSCFSLDHHALDKDTGHNGMIAYFLDDPSGFFGIRFDEFPLELEIQKKLDRETQDKHSLTLFAVDAGSVPLSSTTNLIVTVTDIDDNCPEFDSDSPISATVPGEGTKGLAVAQLKATDKDSGQNARIRFSFSPQVSERARTLFHLEEHTGLIRLAADLQADSPEEHTLKVFASGPRCTPVQTQVTLHVQPAVGLVPALKIKFVAEHMNQTIRLQENEPPTVLAVLELKEASFVRAELSLDAEDVPFALKRQAGNYLLSTTKALDFELHREYKVTVVMSDFRGECGRKVLEVLVEDVNDNAPQFQRAQYEQSIEENNTPGLFLLKVKATDADSDAFGRVRYSLTNPGPFRIHEESGTISISESLDREQQATYSLTVLAKDGGTPARESLADVHVTVLDLNDNPPVFPTKHFYFFVSESLPLLSHVGRLDVSDPDEGDNGKVVDMRLLKDNDSFAVDLVQRSLRSTREIDRERQDRYELVVQAVDGGNPSLSSTAQLTIFVEDVNDNQPRVVLPSSNFSCLTISPQARAGSMVTKIYAVDEDSGMNSYITYQIIASQPAHDSPFQIDAQSGNITLVQNLDGKDHGMHHLYVQIRDGGDPDPLQTTVWVNLLVNDTMERCAVNATPDVSSRTPRKPLPVVQCEYQSQAWVVLLSGLGLMVTSIFILLAAGVVFLKHSRRLRRSRKTTEEPSELKPLNTMLVPSHGKL